MKHNARVGAKKRSKQTKQNMTTMYKHDAMKRAKYLAMEQTTAITYNAMRRKKPKVQRYEKRPKEI